MNGVGKLAAAAGSAEGCSVSADDIKAAPQIVVGLTTTEKWSFDRETLADIHLAALQLRFNDLKDKIAVVGKYAEEQNIHEIRTIEDGGFLLFPHTMYKSYPLSILEKARFEQLTRWLQALTAIDLTHVDASNCDSIDSWIDRLDAQSDLRIRHSSGTTGKLSFIPTSLSEAATGAYGLRRYFQGFGEEPDADLDVVGKVPFILFGARKGATGTARTLDAVVEHLYGGNEDMVAATHPVRTSADMLSFSGRLQGALTRGDRGVQQISPALMARREEFARLKADEPRLFTEVLEKLARLKGRQVVLQGILPLVVSDAAAGLELGYCDMFAANSPVFIAGGTKGQTLPDDYPRLVSRFTGGPFPRMGYGMTEAASGITRSCPLGRYHILPNTIPYLLDAKTGEQQPRTGRQTGRFAFFDIACETRWGGFVSGDKITINFGDEDPCPCGEKGAFIDSEIKRLSEIEGGDDKITCASAPQVHDHALEMMLKTTS